METIRKLYGRPAARVARDARWGRRVRKYPPDFSQSDVDLFEEVRPYTMTSPERLVALCHAIEYIVGSGIEGDIVECGVWKGGSMMAAAKTLLRLDVTDRMLHLFDSFQGMSPPAEVDRDYLGFSASDHLTGPDPGDSSIGDRSPLESIRRALGSTGYPVDRVRYVEGRVEDTLPARSPDRIALLRLDTDWYESTYHEMATLFPRLVPGGVLIIDDYGHWEGARRAVDQYLRENHVRMLLGRIDYTGRIGVKS